jgi:hypothetical protein
MQSEQIDKLTEAFAKASGNIKNASMNKINPHFKSKYADLAAIFDAVRKPLADNGLVVTQTTEIREGGFVLMTMLAHSSGQWIRSEYPLPATGRPQEIGSALTYARRYSLSAITGVAADEDDDAEGAEHGKQRVDTTALKAPKLARPAPVASPVDPDTGEVSPHKIAYEGDPIAWGSKYVAALKASPLPTDLGEWASQNAGTLKDIGEQAPKVFQRIEAAAKTRLNDLTKTLEAAE